MNHEEDNQDEELTPEQIKELKEKASRADELEKTLAEKEEEYSKLSKKEFNFRNLEKAKDEEKKKLMEEFTKDKNMQAQAIVEIERKFSQAEQARLDDAENRFLNSFNDEDFKNKLKEAVKHSIPFLGEPKNPEELTQRYKRAHDQIKDSVKVSGLNAFSPTTTYMDQPSDKKRFTDSDQGKELLHNILPKVFPKIDK